MPSWPGLVFREPDGLEDVLGFSQRVGGYLPKCKLASVDLKQLQVFLQQSSVQFSSVAQLQPILCDPMNRSTPGLPVNHQSWVYSIRDQQGIAVKALCRGGHMQDPTRQGKEQLS